MYVGYYGSVCVCVCVCVVIQLEARLQPNIRFTLRRDLTVFSVHAFGYNSAEREPIWMKSRALGVHCWGLALADFGRDLRSIATV